MLYDEDLPCSQMPPSCYTVKRQKKQGSSLWSISYRTDSTYDLSEPAHFPKTTPPETPRPALVEGSSEGSTHRPHQAKTHHIYWILLIAGWREDLKGGLAEQSTPIKNTTAYQGESSGKELTKLSRKFLKGSGTQIG